MQFAPKLVVGLEIASVGCRLDCSDAPFAALLADRYADFPPTSEPEISVQVNVIEPAERVSLASWVGPYARIGGQADRITIEGADFSGVFDETTGSGAIDQPRDPAPIETLLTAIYASRLLREGGFLLHAATIVGKMGGCVFFGPSGSGKTTVTELVGERVITDEITVVRPGADGYVVSSVPWRGSPGAAPLTGLFRLEHARATSFTRLSPLETVRRLLPSVFFSRVGTREVSRFFETAAVLARSVPAFDMAFTRERAFWNAVPGAA